MLIKEIHSRKWVDSFKTTIKEKIKKLSVLKIHRSESKAEFINTANEIFVETMQFLTRLSARYSRLLSQDVMRLASEVLDNAEKANSIFPSDKIRIELREKHLLEARASLMALDVHLAHCYEIMMLNPQGCFSTLNGKDVPARDAVKKLENMSQSLGEKIDKENNYLSNVIKSDKNRIKQFSDSKQDSTENDE